MQTAKDENRALIALGANMPFGDADPKATLDQAIVEMADELDVLAQSDVFKTPCFPVGAGPDYVNAAVAVAYAGESVDLLAALHGIENRFGRVRDQRWGQRVLDLDLVAHGRRVAPDAAIFQAWLDLDVEDQKIKAPDQLILPHPRLQDRAFVLGPLMDIAPNWQHPVLGQTVAQMWDALSQADRDAITRL